MLGGNGGEECLDIIKGQQALEIVDKNEHEHVVLGVFFLYRRRQQIVFCIVIDHGFGQNLIIRIAPGIF